MTDKTDSKEREAIARAMWSLMREHEDRCDEELEDLKPSHPIWAYADAARASLSANAGEPVAWQERQQTRIGWTDWYDARLPRAMGKGLGLSEVIDGIEYQWRPLYLHPSPPKGMVGGWIALPGALPEPGTPVLLDIGKKYPIRAMWVQKFTLLVGLEDDSGFGEYDERTDEWYCPEGWYEWNEHEETHWAVSATPRAWAPLPPTSSADSRKGE